MTEEWLDFIISCRSGQEHDYDIVIGAMADDQIYNFISDYIDGVITREQFWVLAKFKQDIRELCPTLSDSSIEGALRKLVAAGELKKEGKGKNICYFRLT